MDFRALETNTSTQAWLVSFGDLLTLLLCMFVSIAMVTASAWRVSQAESEVTARNKGQQAPLVPQQGLDLAHGTRIAAFDNEVIEVQFRLTEADFDTQGSILRDEMLAIIKSETDLESYAVQDLRLSTCSTLTGPQESLAWFRSMNRLLEIRSQLLDDGLRPKGIQVRALGPHCDQLPAVQEGSQLVGLVTVLMKRVQHG